MAVQVYGQHCWHVGPRHASPAWTPRPASHHGRRGEPEAPWSWPAGSSARSWPKCAAAHARRLSKEYLARSRSSTRHPVGATDFVGRACRRQRADHAPAAKHGRWAWLQSAMAATRMGHSPSAVTNTLLRFWATPTQRPTLHIAQPTTHMLNRIAGASAGAHCAQMIVHAGETPTAPWLGIRCWLSGSPRRSPGLTSLPQPGPRVDLA